MNMKELWKQISQKNITGVSSKATEKFLVNKKTSKKVLIEVNNIKMSYRHFKKEIVIFDNVSFKIYENEILALLGANGAGKTTIVNIIAGVKNPTNGKIIIHKDHNNNVAYRIGVQFQDLKFPAGLTVKDFINFEVRLLDNGVSVDELNEMIEVFRLKELLQTKILKLSGGQQQRLNVLISLISKPKILFLDEFTTGLDIAAKNAIKNFIIQFCKMQNMTIVLISHDVDTIVDMATRFVLIKDKSLTVSAPKPAIIKKFKTIPSFLEYYIK